MIYIFNETDSSVWDVTDKNDKFFRVGVIGDRHFGIDIVKKDYTLDDFFLDILDPKVVESPKKMFWALSDMSFSICYNVKNGTPFLKPVKRVTPNSYDLYAVTYKKPERGVLINEKSNRFTVISVSEDENLVHIIAIAKPVAKPYYYLTYLCEGQDCESVYHTKHIVTTKSGEISIFRNSYFQSEVEASPYKNNILGKNTPTTISVSRTLRPYSLIIYPFDNETVLTELCEKRYGCSEKYNKYADANAKNLPTVLYNLRKTEYYSAATFYVNRKFDELTKDMALEDCPLSTRFKRVNYLCSDGKVKSFD